MSLNSFNNQEKSEEKVKAVVLAGGEGLRLRPLTYYFQKCMIPIGSKQKPLLEYVIRLLRYHSITEVCILAGYKADQIENYFDDGRRFGVKISYVLDAFNMKGTACALLNAYLAGVLNENNLLLIYYGDILTNLNIKDVLNYHKEKGATATVVLSMNYPIQVGIAELSNDFRIVKFVEKPDLKVPVSIGVLVLSGRVFAYLKQMWNGGYCDLDIMRDLIPFLISRNESVFGYVTSSFWYDVGTTEKYEKLPNYTIEKELSFLF
ncbi:MAG: nucleotidyltransferase family protein [Candidatus Brockarchaeota archaeon]|nr:nucleotidyltransferase family protein [Candidatus Brockarchaeota archaeon]MBO3800751.1 nucleotidyltransferase family protein [Candidatus Brockarchaeota archaeon]